jgi:hypothetical protein
VLEIQNGFIFWRKKMVEMGLTAENVRRACLVDDNYMGWAAQLRCFPNGPV